MIDGTNVELIGEINDAEKPEFLSGAIGLLVPIDWPEPFGLVMIEAMACGTPVIAFNRGSVPEIIEHGVTGFIVEDEAQAVAAVGKLGRLSRSLIRHRFERRFTARRMAEDYLSLYHRLAVKARPSLRVVPEEAWAPPPHFPLRPQGGEGVRLHPVLPQPRAKFVHAFIERPPLPLLKGDRHGVRHVAFQQRLDLGRGLGSQHDRIDLVVEHHAAAIEIG